MLIFEDVTVQIKLCCCSFVPLFCCATNNALSNSSGDTWWYNPQSFTKMNFSVRDINGGHD